MVEIPLPKKKTKNKTQNRNESFTWLLALQLKSFSLMRCFNLLGAVPNLQVPEWVEKDRKMKLKYWFNHRVDSPKSPILAVLKLKSNDLVKRHKLSQTLTEQFGMKWVGRPGSPNLSLDTFRSVSEGTKS